MRGLPFLLLTTLFGFGFTLGVLVGAFWERNQRPRRQGPPPRPNPPAPPEPPADSAQG